MPHLYKAFGQNVQGKPLDKFAMAKHHGLLYAICLIILVGKRDRLVVNGFDPMVADGDLVGIPTQIFHHRMGVPFAVVGVFTNAI